MSTWKADEEEDNVGHDIAIWIVAIATAVAATTIESDQSLQSGHHFISFPPYPQATSSSLHLATTEDGTNG